MSLVLALAIIAAPTMPQEVIGRATWYAAPDHTAAAGPGLRRALGGHWRGMTVRVCHAHRCERVRLTDWCACPKGRVIDLSRAVFSRFEPAWKGVMKVRVTW